MPWVRHFRYRVPDTGSPRSPMLDIRKRTGVLFVVVMVAQIILVSAQVQSRSGVARAVRR